MNVAGIDTPIELWAVAIVVLGGILTAWVTHWRQSGDLKAIRTQTENSHDTNLRDDIDDIRDIIRDGFKDVRDEFKDVRKELRDLRGEVNTERAERIESDARIWRGPWSAS